MTTFISNRFTSNLRFAPQPQAGSKWCVICFWRATIFRLSSASETIFEPLTMQIVGFIDFGFSCLDLVDHYLKWLERMRQLRGDGTILELLLGRQLLSVGCKCLEWTLLFSAVGKRVYYWCSNFR